MARIIKSTGENETANAAICSTCGINLTREREWQASWEVFHCTGQSKAGAPHHHTAPTWGECWRCGKSLGCARCAARTISEAFCRNCKVWGTKEALVEQGLLRGQRIEEYPTRWHHEYFATRSFPDGGVV